MATISGRRGDDKRRSRPWRISLNEGHFSWKRLVGRSGGNARMSRKIGTPLTRSGRHHKIGRTVRGGGWLPMILILMVLASSLVACSSLEADSCEESVAGCPDRGERLSPEEKLQQLIDFCNDYPDRLVCKKNNLGQ